MLRRRLSRGAAAVAAAAALLLADATSVMAADSTATAYGMRFSDGLDSRLAATEFASALRGVGYGATSYTSGRTAMGAWDDGLGSQVYGVFGHGNAGYMQVDEGPTDAEDEMIAAGTVDHINGFYNDGHISFWSNYLPYVDIDDMKLAVFAGCYTANVDPSVGSLPKVAKERGVDSTVAFSGLVYFPAKCTSCLYSGNYFWSRFSFYAKAGDTVSVALSKARSDLVAKEGSAGGWNAWRVDGAADRPGDVRIKPAGQGQPLGSSFFGINPFDLTALTATSSRTYSVEDRNVTDTSTEEGVTFRRDADSGELLWVSAPASVQGSSILSDTQAREAAIAFAEQHLSWFDAAAGEVTDRSVSHEPGDDLHAVTWRARGEHGDGPQRVELEVDKRTGSIVYFSAAQADGSPKEATVSREEAIAAATAAVGSGAAVVSAEQDTWDRPRWQVTFDRPGQSMMPDLVKVTVDATTGKVVGMEAT